MSQTSSALSVDPIDRSLNAQRARLNAALSDPDGWSEGPEALHLLHTSGLVLTIDRTKSFGGPRIYLPYTESVSEASEAENIFCVPQERSIAFLHLNMTPITHCYFRNFQHLSDHFTSVLPMFQSVLRLNFTPAGQAALKTFTQTLRILILHLHPTTYGIWHVRPNEEQYNLHLNGPHQEESFDLVTHLLKNLLDIGLPIYIETDADQLQETYSFEMQTCYCLPIDIPASAHAPARILHTPADIYPAYIS